MFFQFLTTVFSHSSIFMSVGAFFGNHHFGFAALGASDRIVRGKKDIWWQFSRKSLSALVNGKGTSKTIQSTFTLSVNAQFSELFKYI